MHLFFTLFSLLVYFYGCNTSGYSDNSNRTGYNLTTPDKTLILPDTLREVSGITWMDSSTFACIQDENGIIFLVDLKSGKIENQVPFNRDGDYEGICTVDSSIYILRSDGVLFEIADHREKNLKVNSYPTDIPADNNEGLCFDAAENRLLIACKGKIGKGRDFKDRRVIYEFNLTTRKLNTEPVFDFDLQEIKKYAVRHNLDIPTKSRKKGKITEPFIKFMTSAIGIHPVSGKLYLLSAADYLFFIFNRNGSIEHMELLDPELFNKAEGITFLDNGDLLITNEAQDKSATLLLFKYHY